MRPWLLAPVVALLVLPGSAAAQTGGAAAPSETVRASGGAEYGAPIKRVPARLVATRFAVAPATLVAGGPPVRISYRIDGPSRRVRVRVELVAEGAHRAAVRVRLGWKLTGTRRTHRWSPPSTLAPGRYVARLHAVDDAGRRLHRTAVASGRLPVSVEVLPPPPVAVDPAGVFPVGSGWSFGGDDARFGAERPNHDHQGQDITAPAGTPVVAPRPGVVFWRAVQKRGAGHYLVIRGDDGTDYVFMHLAAGSETVAKGDRVAAGQIIASVGSTGSSSGPHLHFEIWPDGWYAKGSHPIDPRPQLEAWATGAAAA